MGEYWAIEYAGGRGIDYISRRVARRPAEAVRLWREARGWADLPCTVRHSTPEEDAGLAVEQG